MSTLFRRQAVLAHGDDHAVAIAWHTPHLRQWAWLILLWLAGSLLWLGQLSFAEKVSADGVVQPLMGPVVVRSPATAVVSEVRVADGSRVQAGQTLVVLDKSIPGGHGVTDIQLQLSQLRDERRALIRQRSRARRLARQRQELLDAQQREALEQARALQQQVQVARQRVALLAREHERSASLAAGRWISAADLQKSFTALLGARQELLGRRHDHQAVLARRQTLQAQLSIQQTQSAERLAELQSRLMRLSFESERLDASERALLTAPIGGVVTDVVAHAGQHLRPGEAVLTVAPKSPAMHSIDVLLPSAAAARVRPGMPVRLRYAGYPHQDHGSARGAVSYVSEVKHTDGRLPLFRARINVTNMPASIDRTPAGMVVSTDILLRSRPLWRWLWQPLQDALARL